jgi:hypothetical protein
MKRTYLFVILCPIALALLVGITTNQESWTEINAATGATRTRTTKALLFAKPWVERSTWVSEQAAQLGINTNSDWQLLGHHKQTWGIATRGCGTAPASFHLRSSDQTVLSTGEQEAFVRSFVKADEETRERLIRELADAS